jgi:hypothetical protein
LKVSNGLFIDARRAGGITRAINHSCDPNAELVEANLGGERRMMFRAIKDIPLHTEITFDYDWKANTPSERKIQCRCKTANCRGYLQKATTQVPKKRKTRVEASDHARQPSKAPKSGDGSRGRMAEADEDGVATTMTTTTNKRKREGAHHPDEEGATAEAETRAHKRSSTTMTQQRIDNFFTQPLGNAPTIHHPP